MTAPKWDANPACLNCLDSGERTIETPTSIGLLRENVPCSCSTGLLLEARITEALTAHWAAHPLTENDRG